MVFVPAGLIQDHFFLEHTMATNSASSWNDRKRELGVIAIAGGRNAQLFVKGNGGVSGIVYYDPAPLVDEISAAATLTTDQLLSRWVSCDASSGAFNLQLPTVAALEAALNAADSSESGSKLVVGSNIKFSIVEHEGTNAVTLTTNTGWTVGGDQGSVVVATGTSAMFMARKSGDAAWSLFRLA